MDTLQTVFSAKIAIVALSLLAGSVMDVRTRRIPDRTWMVLLLACIPLVAWEMWIKGADDSPVSLLSLMLPVGGMLFVLFGYPEISKAFKGSIMDLTFTLIYAACIAGPVISFMLGDRDLMIPVGVASVFMLVYFALYHIPIGGTRIIHGGADAKCLMALAAVFPWYVEDLPYSFGVFYETLHEISSFGYIFPVHLSTLFNGAVISVLILFLILPATNILRGDFAFPRMFTSFKADVDGIAERHVWVILEYKQKKKVDPSERLEKRLKKRGDERVWVTPKIPFILYLFLGFVLHILVGNLVALIFLRF
jgi:prepilin signal peptidase PulO-like enzyme (type II secretory pathway)